MMFPPPPLPDPPPHPKDPVLDLDEITIQFYVDNWLEAIEHDDVLSASFRMTRGSIVYDNLRRKE